MAQPLPAYRGSEAYVFVSYSHSDEAAVFAEIRWLQDQGVNVYFDAGISAGSEWSDALAEAIEHCAYFLYFITPNSVASENCRREVNFAIAENRTIIQAHLQPTDVPGGLRLNLDNRQAVFAYSKTEDYRQQILSAVSGVDPVEPSKPPASRSERSPGLRSGQLVLTAMVLVAALASGYWFYTNQAPTTPAVAATEDIVIAVMPFEHLGPDETYQWWVEGFRSELVNHLQKLASIRLVSPLVLNAVLKDDGGDIDRLKDLGATRAVNGQVTIQGDQVNVLIGGTHLATGEQVLSLRYNARLDDYIALQSETALAIADEFKAAWTTAEKASVDRPATTNLRALALKSEAQFLIGGTDSTDLGVSLLQRAVELDPEYTDAWGMLSWAHKWKANLGDPASWDKAAQFAETAMALDPNNGWARFAQGHVDLYQNKLATATNHFLVGAENAPQLFSMIDDLSLLLSIQGQLVDGLKWGYEAYLIWPTNSNSRFHLSIPMLSLNEVSRTRALLELTLRQAGTMERVTQLLIQIALLQREPERALQMASQLPTDVMHPEVLFIRAHSLVATGRYEDSEAILEKLVQRSPRYTMIFLAGTPEVYLAHVYLKTGQEQKARLLLEEARTRYQSNAERSDNALDYARLAATLVQLGEHDAAMDAFQSAYDYGDRIPHFRRIDPMLQPLLELPEFQILLEKMEKDVETQHAQAEEEGLFDPIDRAIEQLKAEAAPTA